MIAAKLYLGFLEVRAPPARLDGCFEFKGLVLPCFPLSSGNIIPFGRICGEHLPTKLARQQQGFTFLDSTPF
jgi:hypothetical protein